MNSSYFLSTLPKCSLDEYAEMVAAANEIDGDNLF